MPRTLRWLVQDVGTDQYGNKGVWLRYKDADGVAVSNWTVLDIDFGARKGYYELELEIAAKKIARLYFWNLQTDTQFNEVDWPVRFTIYDPETGGPIEVDIVGELNPKFTVLLVDEKLTKS